MKYSSIQIRGEKNKIKISQHKDEDLNPAGGYALWPKPQESFIMWQDGPLGRGEARVESNGAFVEDVLQVCVERLKFFQKSKFKCVNNGVAIGKIEEAIEALNQRTQTREFWGVEGTHEI